MGSIVAVLLAAIIAPVTTNLLEHSPSHAGSITVINNFGTIKNYSNGPTRETVTNGNGPGLPGGVPPLPTQSKSVCPFQAKLPSASSSPSVFVMYVEDKPGSGCWRTDTTVSNIPGTIAYLLGYRNTSHTLQTHVVIRVSLAPKLLLVSSSTLLDNSLNESGVLYQSNNIIGGGIDIGSYDPGGGAWIRIDVATPFPADLSCGQTIFSSVGEAAARGLDYFYNTAQFRVSKHCE
jgi:hypothetical protein